MAGQHRWLCVLFVLGFFTGCSKKESSQNGPVHYRPQPVQVISPKTAETDTGSVPLWFEATSDGIRPVSDPAQSQVVPYAPWTSARRIIGFVVSESFVIGGMNRDGFLVFEETPAGDLALYRLTDDELVAPFCSLSMILVPRSDLGRGGGQEQTPPGAADGPSRDLLPALLVARDPYFIDLSDAITWGSVPANPLVVLDLSNFSLHGTRPGAFSLFNGQKESENRINIDSLERGSDGRWYLKGSAVSTGETGSPGAKLYFAAPSLNKEAAPIDRAAYQLALNPLPFERMPKTAQVLVRSFSDSQRDNHFPILQLLQKDKPVLENYIADPKIKNQVPLSAGETEIIKFLGFVDKTNAVVVLPDGRGVIRRSTVETFTLPPLTEGFVYTGIVMFSRWIIASWEEQESFAVGAAGFLVLPL